MSAVCSGSEFGKTFSEIAVSLSAKGFALPAPTPAGMKYGKKTIDSANVEEQFIKGIDFLDFHFALPSVSAQSSERDEFPDADEITETVSFTWIPYALCIAIGWNSMAH